MLNEAHPDNGGKAAFFRALGFSSDEPELLASALGSMATAADITNTVAHPHGTKYVVDGVIRGPSGKTSGVRTVWIVELELDAPRLVTAYPKK